MKQPAHIVAETLPAKLHGLLAQRTADFQLIIDTDGSLDDDAIVIPSRWEAFGIISHEAVAEQRLTIAASVDGLADLAPEHAVQVKRVGKIGVIPTSVQAQSPSNFAAKLRGTSSRPRKNSQGDTASVLDAQ